jgi:transposase-like protein
MQLKINSFDKDKSKKERINEAIASGIQLKGVENISGLGEILGDIFQNYEFENGILKLREEHCTSCKKKLKRKGTYNKEITLPGGIKLLLTFHQYSCPNCKEKVDRRLGSWFSKGERYSSNVKSDAIRLYLNHLSSYDAIHDELKHVYQIPNLSKRTVRKWLRKVGSIASESLLKERDFSGHFVYDEEYLKVYLGYVGKKHAKLQRIEVYLLLFRDALTGKVILMISDSLDKSILIQYWRRFAKWILRNKIPWITLTTDGKREYNTMIKEINKEFNLKIRHGYCVFHFKKNLFEVSNKYHFGVMQTKKELPEHIINQIKELEKAIDSPTKQEFEETLELLNHQIWTFIAPLQDQIKRMKKYESNYKLHKEFSFLRTTNTCEQWFGRTKPEKIKKGYKTKEGLLKTVQALALKISNQNWKKILGVPKDIKDATQLLMSSILYKEEIKRPV